MSRGQWLDSMQRANTADTRLRHETADYSQTALLIAFRKYLIIKIANDNGNVVSL
jgi:hypothetical protein